MPDPNLAGMSRRSRRSIRPERYWITTFDGTLLREARLDRGLSQHRVAAKAGISLRTIVRLEGLTAATCHRATLHRIAATLGDDPELVISALTSPAKDGAAEARHARQGSTVSTWQCSRTFPARPDQIAEARSFLGRVLHGCPMVDDAKLICSELTTNAVLHSGSGRPGGKVIVRLEVREHDYVWLEVEDQGGAWVNSGHSDQDGRGLVIVAALADYWDIRGDEARRLVCARLDWPESEV